jgi:hypothetical protein
MTPEVTKIILWTSIIIWSRDQPSISVPHAVLGLVRFIQIPFTDKPEGLDPPKKFRQTLNWTRNQYKQNNQNFSMNTQSVASSELVQYLKNLDVTP